MDKQRLAKVLEVARKAAKAAAYLAIAAVSLAVLFVLINLFDEDLHPEVAAYLKQDPPKPPADARNGYFYLVGLSASSEPHAAGMKYVAEVNEAQAKKLKGEQLEWPKGFDSVSFKDPRMCAMDAAPCLLSVAEKEHEARRIVAENKLLLQRYRALLDYPAYAETRQSLLVDAPITFFASLSYGQRAFFTAAALKLRDGQADAALADVERNLAFNRRMLAGSRTLIGKVVAAAHVQRSALLLSEILVARRASLGAPAARLGEALRPLSDEERGLGEALRGEFALFSPATMAQACRQYGLAVFTTDDPGGILGGMPCRVFFQPRATANRIYFGWHKPFLAIDAAPAERFDQALKELRPMNPSFPDMTVLYNPIGKLMLAIGVPEWSEYTASMHDRDAILRLVAAQALIVARRASNADVPKVLAQAGSRYHDPYTGAPMRWDAARGELYFEPKSERIKRIATGGRLGVKL